MDFFPNVTLCNCKRGFGYGYGNGKINNKVRIAVHYVKSAAEF